MTQKSKFITILMLLALAFSVNAAMTTKELTEKADAIIIGNVLEQKAQWNAEKNNIFTTVTVNVNEYLKGEAKSKRQTLVIPGGQVGEIGLKVTEAPNFTVGERALLFLSRGQNNDMSIVGLKYGKFSIDGNKVLENGKSIFAFKKEIFEHLGKTTNAEQYQKIQFPHPELLQERKSRTIPTNQAIESPATNLWEWGYTCVWGDDFEGDFPGTDWTLGHNAVPAINNGYTWGRTINNPNGGNHAVWCAQTNMIPGNPDLHAGADNYPDNSQAWMIAGPFDLSDVYSARLSFDIDQTVDSFDWTGVGFSIDGVWFSLGPDFQFFYTSTGGYIHYVINIEDVIGPLWDKNQVWFSFIFWSDVLMNEKGTWIDNVKLQKYDAHNINPVIYSVNPAVRSAGTGSSVEILGKNLVGEYSTQTAVVEFFSGFYWWDDTMWVQATKIHEWTKERIVCDVPEGASSGKLRVSRHKEGEALIDFDVPFGYLGFKWCAGVGNAGGTDYPIVPFYVNPANPYYDESAAGDDIVGSAETWNSDGGAAIALEFAGTSGVTEPQFDGENTVMFGPIYHIPFGTPALTYIWYMGDKIMEADIILNSMIGWVPNAGAAPDPVYLVTSNIATNEFGNFVGLSDLFGQNDAPKTMFGYHDLWAESFLLDEHASTLAPEDKEGIQWIYGTGLDPMILAESRFGMSPLTVQFKNMTKSVYPITKLLWDFGDGATSKEENPVHVYVSKDEEKYDVSLTVWADDGSSIIKKTVKEKNYVELNCRIAASIDAAPTVGYGPLSVQFSTLSLKGSVVSYLWNFGDGTTSTVKHPIHVYNDPGIYNVSLTVKGPSGTFTEAVPGLVEVYEDAVTGVSGYDNSIYIGMTDLALVEGSPCYGAAESWDNAIDHDTYHWSGTTNAGKKGKVYAIFKFADDSQKKISRVRLLTDTGVPDKVNDWVQQFTLLVSTTTTENEAFTAVGTFDKTTGYWDDYSFDPIDAKYVKFVVESPSLGWRQIGEFEVYEHVAIPQLSGSSVSVTAQHIANGYDAATVTLKLADAEGNAVSNLPASAFRILALPTNTVDVNLADTPKYYTGDSYNSPVVESETAGTYYCYISSIVPGEKRIIARIYSTKLEAENTLVFTEPTFEKAELALTTGTETWANEGWDNAIDGDIDGHDGTVSAGPKWKDCNAIFEFADGATKPIIKYRLITDTGMEYKQNLVTYYAVYVSTTGTADEDFVLVDQRERNIGNWEEFLFVPVEAKYIKLVLLEPKKTWRQIGEFEVYTTPMIGSLGTPGIAANDAKLSVLPKSYTLEQNYPNPFNPETMIAYQLPEASNVQLRVFNMIGQEVRTLVNTKQAAGQHQIIWDARDNIGNKVTSGVYFYKLEAANGDKKFTKKMKMTLIR